MPVPLVPIRKESIIYQDIGRTQYKLLDTPGTNKGRAAGRDQAVHVVAAAVRVQVPLLPGRNKSPIDINIGSTQYNFLNTPVAS